MDVKKINGSAYDVGSIYLTEKNELLFVKENLEPGYYKKVRGEYESLKVLRETKTIATPRPVAYGQTKTKDVFFMAVDYLNMTSVDVQLEGSDAKRLGSLLADLHMYNWKHNCKKHPPVKKFGFHMSTSGGAISQNNTWTDDWITFFIENRMNYHMRLLRPQTDPEKKKRIEKYWSMLKPKVPEYFKGLDIKPTLLHGDFWEGNIALYKSKPIVFDPASFYGHHEYDLATSTYLGGFSPKFYDSYFEKIPELPGFENRVYLYHLYINLYRWNNYEGGYVDLVLDSFEKLLDVKKEIK